MLRRLAELAAALLRVDGFYDSLGGLAGYQLTCLQLCAAAAAEPAQGTSPGEMGGVEPGRGSTQSV